MKKSGWLVGLGLIVVAAGGAYYLLSRKEEVSESETDSPPGALESLGLWSLVQKYAPDDADLVGATAENLEAQAAAARALGDDFYASALGRASTDASVLFVSLGESMAKTLTSLTSTFGFGGNGE